MSKNEYTEQEQQNINIMKYQDEELRKLLDEENQRRIEREAEIEKLEEQLINAGIDLNEIAKKEDKDIPKQVVIVPSWKEMCKLAEKEVGNECKIEQLFTKEELKSNELAIKQLNKEYNQIHKLDKTDVAISAFASIIGAAVDILLVGIPEPSKDGVKAGPLSNYIRERFNQALPEKEMIKLANSKESKVPFDAQDNRNTKEYVEGLSSYYHRLYELGHDPLLGFVVGVFDILTGRMTTIDQNGKFKSQVMENYADRKESDVFEALAKQIVHFKSDVTTSMGLPAPLMGVFNLFQFGSIGEQDQTIAEIVKGMYYEGYDFIHFCSLSIPVMLIEVIVRISYAFKRIKEGHSIKDSIPYSLKRDKHPKLCTMLFIAHSGATAINAGKVYFSKKPTAINYVQWIAFAKYSYKQLKWIIKDKPEARAAYVEGKLNENWKELSDNTDETFKKFSEDYVIVFE